MKEPLPIAHRPRHGKAPLCFETNWCGQQIDAHHPPPLKIHILIPDGKGELRL